MKVSALFGDNWDVCTLNDVLYVPGSVNLFSESKCAKLGCEIRQKSNNTIYLCSDGSKGPCAYLIEGIYILKFERVNDDRAHFSQSFGMNVVRI